MAKITNKDEVLKHMGDFHAQHYKIAKLLIGAHAVGVTTCVTIFKDPASALKVGNLSAFVLVFGIGLIASVAYYASIFMTQAVVKNAIKDDEDPNDSPSKGFLLAVNIISIGIAVLTFVVGILMVIVRSFMG
jgi:hypothetical protein